VKNEDIRNIMVVDDTKSITFALEEWLKDEGIANVNVYQDPERAVEAIQKDGAPDLIITDYDMPGMNGVEFLEEVNSCNNVKAIIMTAHPSELSSHNKSKKYDVIEKSNGFMEKIINRVKALRLGKHSTEC
jgi:DNA-binding NtrC family response regulator